VPGAAAAPERAGKQSANVDAVSGATYTSDGYKTALQSALEAGFQAPTPQQ
jgi:uncharacterized protein with FMN-binding domain